LSVSASLRFSALPCRLTNALLLAAIALGAMACDAPQLVAPAAANVALPASASPSLASGSPSVGLATLIAAPQTIHFSTYEGSGEVVHPDVVTFATPWNGHRYWNAITPYPKSATKFENPSLFASEDGDSWVIPSGVTNPLQRTTRGYLSDPDMLFEPTSNQLWLYYREVEEKRVPNTKVVHVADHVWLTTSADAVHWSAPRRVASDLGRFVVSPSIVRTDAGAWRMYQVDAGTGGCSSKTSTITLRRSTDGLAWSNPVPAGLVQPGFVPWHMDVQYVPARHEYWALVAAYVAARGCTTTSLFLATSPDGTTWTTYPTPVLSPGELPEFSAAVYRSTFAYEGDDNVTIWFSGARVARAAAPKQPAIFAWSAAVTHTTAGDLLARVKDNAFKTTLSVIPQGSATLAPSTNVP
jgi:hypothetical protein